MSPSLSSMKTGIGNFGDDLKGKLMDATGNVTKAYLCVRDIGGKEEDTKDLKNFNGDSKIVQEAILKAAATKMTRGKFGDVAEKAGKFTGSAESVLKMTERGVSSSNRGLSLEELSTMMAGRYIPIQVQYNPSSLHFRSDAGGIRRINPVEGVGAGGDGQTIKDIPKNTELTCTLIFEKINVNDAFIQASEGWNASLGNITSTIGSAINKLTGGAAKEAYSVRKEVEGFLSLLSTTYTRDVIFFYGKMCFHGELTMASANYKMFNKNGDPIFAEVTIRIRQDGQNDYDNKRWRSSYDALFKDADELEPSGFAASTLGKGFKQITNAFNGGIF